MPDVRRLVRRFPDRHDVAVHRQIRVLRRLRQQVQGEQHRVQGREVRLRRPALRLLQLPLADQRGERGAAEVLRGAPRERELRLQHRLHRPRVLQEEPEQVVPLFRVHPLGDLERQVGLDDGPLGGLQGLRGGRDQR